MWVYRANGNLRTWVDIVLRRHGGRFATHHVLSLTWVWLSRNFRKVERIVRSLTAGRLAAARVDLEGELRQDGRRRCGGGSCSGACRCTATGRERPREARPNAADYGVLSIGFTLNPRLAAGIPHPRPRRGRGGIRLPKQAERFVHGQSRMDWQDKDMLVIDDVSMLGARTLHAMNEAALPAPRIAARFRGCPYRSLL
ncbi:hypothetical protein CDV31_017309 [Fusarium ambrosium]|uniref:Uncharacterized protein n=1 Tax=Fusarium ambrosium TaxID=131363 RepID=A0A428RJP0_9HYPO|nr:hypothetical protein CDV31_017309 [Fusarium ambrosium]